MITKMKLPLAGLALMLVGCGGGNNLLLGHVEATVGTHDVQVTDCYRTSVPSPVAASEGGVEVYRFTPCRDAEIVIRGEFLTVNGKDYGRLQTGDSILVDHGAVSVRPWAQVRAQK